VNNEIYPWSTYAYLPILVILGAVAEFGDYRKAILFGTAGRIATRLLLLYGESLISQQMGQVTYALGTVAEDLFVAYIYYVLPRELYEGGTGALKAAGLISHMLAGILADLLVVQGDVSLRALMWISCVFVFIGTCLGFYLIQPLPSASTALRLGGERRDSNEKLTGTDTNNISPAVFTSVTAPPTSPLSPTAIKIQMD
jgi:hypothetical protein